MDCLQCVGPYKSKVTIVIKNAVTDVTVKASSLIVQGGGKLREERTISSSEFGVISPWRRVDANRRTFQARCYGLAHSETECVIPVPVTGAVLRLV
jgi:hypothetical protein